MAKKKETDTTEHSTETRRHPVGKVLVFLAIFYDYAKDQTKPCFDIPFRGRVARSVAEYATTTPPLDDEEGLGLVYYGVKLIVMDELARGPIEGIPEQCPHERAIECLTDKKLKGLAADGHISVEQYLEAENTCAPCHNCFLVCELNRDPSFWPQTGPSEAELIFGGAYYIPRTQES